MADSWDDSYVTVSPFIFSVLGVFADTRLQPPHPDSSGLILYLPWPSDNAFVIKFGVVRDESYHESSCILAILYFWLLTWVNVLSVVFLFDFRGVFFFNFRTVLSSMHAKLFLEVGYWPYRFQRWRGLTTGIQVTLRCFRKKILATEKFLYSLNNGTPFSAWTSRLSPFFYVVEEHLLGIYIIFHAYFWRNDQKEIPFF